MNVLRQLSRLTYFIDLWTRLPLGSVSTRVAYGIFPYPHYAYGVYWAATLAARLGIPRISVAEFGVAGGRGLIALENSSREIEEALGVGIDVVGFDSGRGMPEPLDYRDLPHIWNTGFYLMDEEKLRTRLKKARLVIGDVKETVTKWLQEEHTAPIGFLAFDLDYYSSTKAAFAVFEGPRSLYLPRIHCYFDDVASSDLGCMNEYVGELLAIKEFNSGHTTQKISRIEQLRANRPRWEIWQDRMYACHDFQHPQYQALVIPRDIQHSQLPL